MRKIETFTQKNHQNEGFSSVRGSGRFCTPPPPQFVPVFFYDFGHKMRDLQGGGGPKKKFWGKFKYLPNIFNNLNFSFEFVLLVLTINSSV